MKPKLQYLSDSDIENIHECSLKILSEIGMKFPAREALETFDKAGARIDNDTVFLNETVITDALKKTRKRNEVTLYAMDPAQDVIFETHDPALSCMTMATSVIDPWTRVRRAATNQDLAQLVRIADELEYIRVAGGLVTPQDVNLSICDWHTWATCLKNTTKHITGGVLGYKGVQDAIQMGGIAAGGVEKFLKRPSISGWVLTLPPLSMDTESLEAMMEMNRSNIPIMLSSGPILGSTAPVTLPGTVAQAHAEILACITLSQLIQPGAPLVYTSFARGMNMKTSNISMGGPEFAVLKVTMAQMGLWLDLPIRMPSMLRDAKVLDAQAGFETGVVGSLSSFNADIMDAMQLDTDLTVDFADMIFCNDCMAFIRHALREVKINPETLAFDVIKSVGPGGNYLTEPHTFQNFKTELWHSELFDHDNWDSWHAKGAKTIRESALEKVQTMLKKEYQPIVSQTQSEKIDQIVEDAGSKG